MKQNSSKRTMAFAVAMMLTMGMSMSVWADEADDYAGISNENITQESHQKQYGRDVVYGAWADKGVNFTFNGLKFGDGSSQTNKDGKPLGKEIAADNGGMITINKGSIDIPNGYLSTEGGTIKINDSTVKNSGAWVNSGAITFKNSTLQGGTLHVGADSSSHTTDDGTLTLDQTNATVDKIEASQNTNQKNTISIMGGSTIQADSTIIDGEGSSLVFSQNAANNTNTFSTNNLDIKNNGQIEFQDDTTVHVNNVNIEAGKFIVSGNSQSIINGEVHISNALEVKGNGNITFTKNSSAYTKAVYPQTRDAQSTVDVEKIVDAENDKNVTIEQGAKLFIKDAKADKTTKYSLKNAIAVKDNNTYKGTLWQQIYGDNVFTEGTIDKDGNVVFQNNYAVLKDYSIAPNLVLYAASDEGKKTAAGQFVDTAFGVTTNGDVKKGAAAFDSAVMMASFGGVAYGTYGFGQDLDTMIANHDRTQQGIWASYLHQDKTVDGFNTGNTKANYDLKYNGVILGSDFHTTDTSRTGAAFAYAKGDISSYGNTAYTKNDNKYYGIGLYHDITLGDMTYRADLGYVRSDNDLTQYNLGQKLTGSPDGSAWYASVRAEKAIATGHSVWTPYVGLRYMQVKTDTFTDSLGISHDMDNANIWNIPVGVSFRHTTQSGAWKYSPVAEIGYVFAAGDKDVNETVRLGTASNNFSSELAENHFVGRVGFEAANTDMTVGAHYQYQKGSSTKANTWDVQVGFKF